MSVNDKIFKVDSLGNPAMSAFFTSKAVSSSLPIEPPKNIPKETFRKLTALKDNLKSFKKVLVAFSGGVDSTFLAHVAYDVLGSNATALTAVSPTLSNSEKNDAINFAKLIGIEHIIVNSNEMNDENFSTNPVDRCYYCKSELYELCAEEALKKNISTVVDGFNLDDNLDTRYGKRAAAEKNILSPLNDAGLTKKEIRDLSYHLGLPSWNKPELACLSSRIPTNTAITDENLRQVEAGEAILKTLGLSQVRVRYHNELAIIETLKEEQSILHNRENKKFVDIEFKKIGFEKVEISPEGYSRSKEL